VAISSPEGFGALLKHWRIAAGLTQEELAEHAGLSARGISDLERGLHLPQRATTRLLATSLGLDGATAAVFERAARGQVDEFPDPIDRRARSSPPPLIGRDREQAILAEYLMGTETPLLVLEGEPGIGKSRLLQEAADRGAATGMIVLHGNCHRGSAQVPYAPLADALARHVARMSLRHLQEALQGCSWLVHLLPELADVVRQPWPTDVGDSGQARRLMFGAVARFLANIGGPAGSVLVLDDLQWTGIDALDLLATLIDGARDSRLRIVGAFRTTEVDDVHPLFNLMADLGSQGMLGRIVLGPLQREEAHQLLVDLMGAQSGEGGSVTDQILERAGGVPFFLVSCAQGVLSGGETMAVPWTLAQSVRQRVAQCSAPAQRVLRTAAVAGRPVPRSTLVVAAEVREAGTVLALDEACAAGLLEESERHIYRLSHDVIREVIEATLGPEERNDLHGRVGQALEAAGTAGLEAELAQHFLEAADPERAVKYSLLAGDRAQTLFAHEEAELHFRQAADLAAAGTKSSAEALCKRGFVLRAIARPEEALHCLLEGAHIYRTTGDTENEALATAHLAQTLGDLGWPREGIDRIRALLPSLREREHQPALAVLQTALASLFWSTGQYDEQLAAAAHAAELAQSHDEPTRLRAEVQRGQALRSLGRYEEARQVLTTAIPSIEADGAIELLAPALDSLSIVHLAAGRFHDEAQCLRQGLDGAYRVGDPSLVAFMTCKLGQNAYYTGEWTRAGEYLVQTVSGTRSLERLWFAPYALGALGGLRLAEGDWDAAEACLATAIALSEESGFQARENAQSLMAVLEIARGESAAAAARLESFVGPSGHPHAGPVGPVWVLAWALHELGHDDRAADIVQQAVQIARRQGDRLATVHLLWVQAKIASQCARWEEAERALRDVLAATREMPYPYHEGRALEVQGAARALQGHRQAAQRSFNGAPTIFRRLGAQPAATRMERALWQL
jgi:tetratricopeptide (TPR) repeat protein/transcriptional regulator with XRE-family HTH domain